MRVRDETLEAVLPGETRDDAFAVFPGSAGKVARHAAIERAVRRFVMMQTQPPFPSIDDTKLPRSSTVMPGLVPGIHVFFCMEIPRRGWPQRVRP